MRTDFNCGTFVKPKLNSSKHFQFSAQVLNLSLLKGSSQPTSVLSFGNDLMISVHHFCHHLALLNISGISSTQKHCFQGKEEREGLSEFFFFCMFWVDVCSPSRRQSSTNRWVKKRFERKVCSRKKTNSPATVMEIKEAKCLSTINYIVLFQHLWEQSIVCWWLHSNTQQALAANSTNQSKNILLWPWIIIRVKIMV